MTGQSTTLPRRGLEARIAAVRERVDIAAVIGRAGVKLSRGKHPRGKCPFHGSKSDSFAVYPDAGFAKCWGCDWAGDAIKFVSETYRKSFVEALELLEAENGLDGQVADPKRTEKVARASRGGDRAHIDSLAMARWIWKGAAPQPGPVRTYLRARGVPEAMLGAERLHDIRFHALAPVTTWPAAADGSVPHPPGELPKAPAICALIRRPVVVGGVVLFAPIGLHVTFLAPSFESKMERRRRDGGLWRSRIMLGEAQGGCVILGLVVPAPAIAARPNAVAIDPAMPLFVGEGIETVLSGMALAGAGTSSIGIAALMLQTLQGHPKLWKGGVWPLHDIRPDPDKTSALAFPHAGSVTGLMDADMAPLRGPRDPDTDVFRGLPVVERRGGAIVRRAISSAERTAICAELFTAAWREAGCRQVKAVRPHMGLDFNDALRSLQAGPPQEGVRGTASESADRDCSSGEAAHG